MIMGFNDQVVSDCLSILVDLVEIPGIYAGGDFHDAVPRPEFMLVWYP